MGQLG
ncbi:hypothetical protein D030_2968A, partial [Vibrio parahaemolyticus AQ3810]